MRCKKITNLEQIRDILLRHRGKKNAITAEAIAEEIKIEPGPSGVTIRDLITETIVTYRLPVASTNRGYYFLEDEDDLKRYQKSLDGRANKITTRRVLITQYFYEYYNLEDLELTKEIFEDKDIESELNDNKSN